MALTKTRVALTAAGLALTVAWPATAATTAPQVKRGTESAAVTANPVNREDVLGMWGGGDLEGANYIGNEVNAIPYGAHPDEVHPLNAKMSKYFTLGTAEYWYQLVRRKNAPAPPTDYWTRDWFTIGYTELVDTDGDGTVEPVEMSVEFAPPVGKVRVYKKIHGWHGVFHIVGQIRDKDLGGVDDSSGVVPHSQKYVLDKVSGPFADAVSVRLRNYDPDFMDGASLEFKAKTKAALNRVGKIYVTYHVTALDRTGKRISSNHGVYVMRLRDVVV